MKRSIHVKCVSAVMAFVSFITLGCGGPADSGNTPSTSMESPRQALDGRTLYKGMIFGVGPAATHFAEIWQRPDLKAQLDRPELQEKRELAAERLSAKVAELDPAFFERFATELRSGNHLTIDRLLTETREKTSAAAEALRKEAGLPEGVTAANTQIVEAGTWFYVETVVAVVLAAIATIVLTQFDATPVAPGGEVSALQRDAWVDMLANKRFDAQ